MAAISRVCVSGPVLALTILQDASPDVVVYGELNWICSSKLPYQLGCSLPLEPPTVFREKNNDARKETLQIFESHNVHGIIPSKPRNSGRRSVGFSENRKTSEWNLLIYGENSIALVGLERGDTLSGWILRANIPEILLEDFVIWAHSVSEDEVAVLFAHNTVAILSSSDLSTKERIRGFGRSLLTAATFVSLDGENRTVLFAGTCFGEVLAADLRDPSAKYTLGDCGGVVFDLCYNQARQDLYCVSDDRACRIFHVGFSPHRAQGTPVISSCQLLHILYGHEARIWKVISLSNWIITAGENSQICVWTHDGKMVKEWTNDVSGDIRSLVAAPGRENQFLFGGEDGSVQLREIKAFEDLERRRGKSTVQALTTPKNERVRKVAILNHTTVLTLVDGGRLYALDTEKDGSPWCLVTEEKELSQIVSIVPLDTFGTSNHVALLSAHGKIFDLNYPSPSTRLILQYNLEQSCMELQILSIDSSRSLFVVSGPSGTISFLLRYHESMSLLGSIQQNAKSSWITASLLWDDLAICGDRGGSIRYIRWSCERQPELLRTDHHVHGSNEVSHLARIGDCLFSSGRNGKVVVWRISSSEGGLSVTRLRVLQDPENQLEWIAGFVPSELASSFVAFGFLSSSFIIKDFQTGNVLGDVICGGGNRSTSVRVVGKVLRFVFSKQSTVQWVDFRVEPFKDVPLVIKPGLQGNRIWSVKNLGTMGSESCKSHIYALAGDDCTVRLFSVIIPAATHLPPAAPNPISICRGHLSAVRCSSRSVVSEHTFYSAGGRGQIIKWTAPDGYSAGHVVPTWEWTPFPVVRKKWSDSALLDPDVRVMSLAIFAHENKDVLVAGESSGAVCVYMDDRPIGSIPARNCCILHVKTVFWHGSWHIISCGTDGNILLHRIDVEHAPDGSRLIWTHLFSRQCHQSGIDCLDVNATDNSLRIASGGDDNAMSILVFADATGPTIPVGINNASAHSAQISGIALLPDHQLLSASKDQLIKVWNVDYSRHEISLVKVMHTMVADLAAIDIRLDRIQGYADVAVVGAGLEILRLKLDKGNGEEAITAEREHI